MKLIIPLSLFLLFCISQNEIRAQALVSSTFKIDADSALTILHNNAPLLTYQFNTVYPPLGIDTLYKRSGFIHPLYTPRGQLLTSIQPPDHYHHYGIWNPWTHTLFEKDTIDFWNLKSGKGTVRFVNFTNQYVSDTVATYTTLQEHIALKPDNTATTALLEWQQVTVYPPDLQRKKYIVDIVSTLRCASQSEIRLLTYRYGGFAWRATNYWDKNNCEVLTSEGKNRATTDGSTARWCMAQGSLPDNEWGGLLLLSHPDNYNHPEPLRIWDENSNNGRGDLFINFSPTKTKDWLLLPGNTYTLSYRLVVFNDKMSQDEAEAKWQQYITQKRIQ